MPSRLVRQSTTVSMPDVFTYADREVRGGDDPDVKFKTKKWTGPAVVQGQSPRQQLAVPILIGPYPTQWLEAGLLALPTRVQRLMQRSVAASEIEESLHACGGGGSGVLGGRLRAVGCHCQAVLAGFATSGRWGMLC